MDLIEITSYPAQTVTNDAVVVWVVRAQQDWEKKVGKNASAKQKAHALLCHKKTKRDMIVSNTSDFNPSSRNWHSEMLLRCKNFYKSPV